MLHNVNAMDQEEPLAATARSKPKITMSEESVTIESENLYMRNIRDKEDLVYYGIMFFNLTAMEKYMNGGRRSLDEIVARHEKYLRWWKEGRLFTSYLTFLNQEAAARFIAEEDRKLEPYRAFISSLKREDVSYLLKEPERMLDSIKNEFKETGRLFIGHVLAEEGDDRGLVTDSEGSYTSIPEYWNNGFMTEAVGNIVEFAKTCHAEKKLLNNERIDTLIATARPDNPGSCKVLERNGFKVVREEVKFGALRRLYALKLVE